MTLDKRATTITAAMWAALLLVVLAMCIGGCAFFSKPKPAPADCKSTCARGEALGCDWAKPSPRGATCAEVCESANTILPWNTECVNKSENCEQAAICR